MSLFPETHGTPPSILAPSRTRILVHDESFEAAIGLFRRYSQLFIGASVVRGILELRTQQLVDPSAASLGFSRKRSIWESNGGYLETVTEEDFSSWISSASFIVAEAAEPGITENEPFVPVAQSIYRLPSCDWVIPLLVDPPDEIHDAARYRQIMADGPLASALIDYLGVLPEWAQSKLAGLARHAGMLEVIRQNGTRPEGSKIRHVIGLAFAIQGVELYNSDCTNTLAEVVALRDLGEGEIVNRRSARAISASKRCPARLIGKWNNTPPVPIVMDDRPYGLQVHWYCFERNVDEVVLSL